MRFKDIAIHNPDLNYPLDENSFYGYSGDFTVDATEELITVANKIRTDTRHIPIREIEFVIRCKNCRYYYATNNVCHRLITVFRMEPEDFCSYGERKDEE